MNATEYKGIADGLIDLAHQIEQAKRPAYTIGNADVLYNFKSVAARVGITPLQALAVYMLKHFDAITAYAKDPNIPQAEDIEGRLADAINYLKLDLALIREMQKEPEPFVLPQETELITILNLLKEHQVRDAIRSLERYVLEHMTPQNKNTTPIAQ